MSSSTLLKSEPTAANKLHRYLHNFNRPKLLIIYEVGYLQLKPAQASLLFQVLAQRYDTGGATAQSPIGQNPPLGPLPLLLENATCRD